MINLGTYHYFRWYKTIDEIESGLISHITQFDIILTGTPTVTVVNASTGATVTATVTTASWEFNGVDIESTRVTMNLTDGVTYYLVIDGLYYSNLFKKDICTVLLETSNSCANIYHNWDGDSPMFVSLYEAIQLEPEYTEENVSIIGIYGEVRKTTKQKVRHRYKFVGGMGMVNMLNGIKNNDTNAISGVAIKNIEYELEESESGDYATYTLSFELNEIFETASSCCEIINIDTILSPENESGTCTGFEVNITESSGTYTANLVSPPTGTPVYRWFLNGVYLSGGATISTAQTGDFRVDVKIGDCKASGYYFTDDPCKSFGIELYATGSEINGDLINLPTGETATYEIKLNNTVVGTALPYEATETGTYYVYVTTESCNKSRGIYVKVDTEEDCGYTLDITEDGNVLEADTDAVSPTYLWELETKDGKVTIGTGATVTMTGKGIYWLTVSAGECSKQTYIYKEPSSDNVVCVLARSNGYQFDVYEINLLDITNPALELDVFINGVRAVYVASAPSGANQYSINGTGKLITNSALPLSNATIVIKKK
jgi:hypothetical protein